MKEKLLKERSILEGKLKDLNKRQMFYDNALIFDGNKELGETIVGIINKIEKEEYILGEFALKEEDTTEIRYHHSEPDPSGCSSWGSNEPSSYEVNVPGTSFSSLIIMDQNSYGIFKSFLFSKCNDLKLNLSIFLTNKKHSYINKRMSANDFQSFPYIGEFLNILSQWRYENRNLDIPSNILDGIVNDFVESKTSSQLAKK